jgi:hypothetical protein
MLPVEWRPLNLLQAPPSLQMLGQKPVFITHEDDRQRALTEFRPWLEYPYNGGFYVWTEPSEHGGDSSSTGQSVGFS